MQLRKCHLIIQEINTSQVIRMTGERKLTAAETCFIRETADYTLSTIKQTNK
jgi:hypothetical protein